MSRPIWLFLLLSFAGVVSAADAKKSGSELTQTRVVMDQIMTSMTKILPISISQEEFEKPENRPAILKELANLKGLSGGLEHHTKRFDGSFEYIAKSMARDLREVYDRFDRGATSEARFLLHHVVENCSTCHSKLPDPGHAPSQEAFFKGTEIAKLSPFEKVRLKVALRQFDGAVKDWEEIFATWSKPAELYAMDALVDYLKITIRVLGDPARANVTLGKITNNVAVPKFLKREILGWRASLSKIGDLNKKGNELARARSFMKAASSSMEYPLDRVGIVDYIAASALLNRYLGEGKATKDQKSEAYLLLGRCDALIGRSAWLSQSEFYFENAVRVSPGSKYAGMALDSLEQLILSEYSGSGGTRIPDDIQQNLEELRRLVASGKK